MTSGRKPLHVDWAAIKRAYLYGEPVRKIAARFGVSAGTISSRRSREGWHRLLGQTRQDAPTFEGKTMTQTEAWEAEIAKHKVTLGRFFDRVNTILSDLDEAPTPDQARVLALVGGVYCKLIGAEKLLITGPRIDENGLETADYDAKQAELEKALDQIRIRRTG